MKTLHYLIASQILLQAFSAQAMQAPTPASIEQTIVTSYHNLGDPNITIESVKAAISKPSGKKPHMRSVIASAAKFCKKQKERATLKREKQQLQQAHISNLYETSKQLTQILASTKQNSASPKKIAPQEPPVSLKQEDFNRFQSLIEQGSASNSSASQTKQADSKPTLSFEELITMLE